jgi:tetratricopeptide (TPR) repeat protein
MNRRYLYLTIALAGAIVAIIAGCGSEPGAAQIEEGASALASGEYVLAKTWFENAINDTSDPDLRRRAYNYLGVASWHLNELPQALAAFNSAREISGQDAEAVLNLGLIALETGSIDEAVDLLEEAAMLADDSRSLEYLALAYMRSGRWADARRNYLEALKQKPESPRLLTSAGLAEFQLARYEEAEEFWSRALEIDEKYPAAIYNLAVLKRSQPGGQAQAAELIERFGRLKADDQRAARMALLAATPGAQLPVESAGANAASENDLVALARAKRRSEGSSAALNLCLQAATAARRRGDELAHLQALQTAAAVCFDQARAHYALGRYYLENGDLSRATRALRQAVTISPDWVSGQIAFAECSIASENFDAALISLRKALASDADNREALWLLAGLYDKYMDDASAALEQYSRFARLYPGDPRTLKAQDVMDRLRRRIEQSPSRTAPANEVGAASATAESRMEKLLQGGAAAQQKGDWKAAARYFIEAVKLQPSSSSSWFNLGLSYAADGRRKEAADSYRRALALQPYHISARFNLALLEYKRGADASAAAELEKILQSEPGHAKAHFLLGVIYSGRLDDKERARQHYRRYLQLDPDDRNAPAVREWLRSN